MEKLLLGLVLLGGLVAGAQGCPFHCTCQNLSESLSTLCADKGLLFVPVNIDRRTVELRLADNFIRTVEQQDFLNMSGLVDLTLSRNTIGFIQPFSFGDLESLRSLHLDGNRLVALREDNLSGLVNLQHLIVNNNQLASIVASAFDHFQATLEDLDLSFNNLQRVPWGAIGGMGNLHTLNLDHNLIEHVAAGTFGELLKLARLDMTSNRLQTLPPDPLFARSQAGLAPPTPRPPPVSLNFGGNPLHCNCQLLWLRRLARDDDMETCATPAPLAGRYFWRVAEEEFVCEPPLITRHTHKVWVLEGQRATLKCRAIGDPEPEIHWVSPRDRMVANSSRVTSYGNGTLDILVATAGDDGAYTCFAANAAGESTARAELRIIPLPHRGDGNGNGNGSAPPRLPHAGPGPGPGRTPGSSDISTSTRPLVNGTEGRRERQGAVSVGDVTGTGALVRWTAPASRHAVWMYQIQYNSSVDDTLVYRIIPSSSRAFALRNLISGVDYDLCVLAIHGDAATQLAATAVVGCARFGTSEEYPHCHPLHARLLGGTLTVAAGGVVVVALLLFTVGAMVKYRLCGNGGAGRLPKVTDVHSQTNGAAAAAVGAANTKMAPPPPSSSSALHQRGKRFRSRARGKRGGAAEGSAPGRDRDRPRPRPPPPAPPRLLLLPKAKRSCSLDMGEAAACYGYTAKSFGAIWTKRSQSVHGTLVELAGGGGSTDDDGYGLVDNRTTLCSSGEMEESIV